MSRAYGCGAVLGRYGRNFLINMIYLIYGSNFTRTREKMREILATQLKKDPDASYFRFEIDTWEPSRLEELIASKGLFQKKLVVILDNLLADKEVSKEILENIKSLAESENIFVFIESTLTKEVIKKMERVALKVQCFDDEEVAEKEEKFKIFTLADAFGAKDKKKLWILYQKALRSYIAHEQIHGILFWQVKAMLMSLQAKSAKESGLNPYVYSKSLRFAKNYTEDELKKLSTELVRTYHESRRGIIDFESALERFVLSI